MNSRTIIAMLALASISHPAAGTVFSNLTEQGTTATIPQAFVQLANMRELHPSGHIQQSAFGDEALSRLQLGGNSGMMTLATHACSGPALMMPGGTASASGFLYYEEQFVIQSSTLPAGTPVLIDVRLAVARAFRGSFIFPDPNAPPSFGSASVTGHTGVRVDTISTTAAAFSGDFEAGASGLHPPSHTQSGVLGVGLVNPSDPGSAKSGEYFAQVPGIVGGQFNFAIQTTLSAGSGAGNPSIADADGQISICWGARVLGGAAEIRSPMDGLLFPTYGDATGACAMANLPSRPGAPAPGAAGLLGCAAFFAARRRRTLALVSPR